MRPALAILFILCLALGGALLLKHQKALDQAKRDEIRIVALSNDLAKASNQRDELQRISLFLETNLTLRSTELQGVSNNLIRTSADLERSKNDAKAAAEAFQAEMKKRDGKIADLEVENNTLEKQSDELKGSINGLEKAIVDTEKKLAASEGDKEFLLKELKRLQTEKADLERRFNDLVELRKQVSELKEELSIARRMDWLKKGIFGFTESKGGAMLVQGRRPLTNRPPAVSGTNMGLQAEIRSDGSATIVTPKAITPPPQPVPPAEPPK
jgi:septal ring factor EnvC (AmiA/AmiB activator)